MDQKYQSSKERIIRLREVQLRTGISRSGIYQRIKEQSFPKPISLGGRCMGFIESEIDQWISERIQKSKERGRV